MSCRSGVSKTETGTVRCLRHCFTSIWGSPRQARDMRDMSAAGIVHACRQLPLLPHSAAAAAAAHAWRHTRQRRLRRFARLLHTGSRRFSTWNAAALARRGSDVRLASSESAQRQRRRATVLPAVQAGAPVFRTPAACCAAGSSRRSKSARNQQLYARAVRGRCYSSPATVGRNSGEMSRPHTDAT